MSVSFQQKLEKGHPIWVLNRTRKPASVVVMTFAHNGANQTVKIPPSKYPVQLCPALVSKDMCANGGQQLSSFLASGALKMIPNKKAKSLLAEPGAQEEMEAMVHRTNSDAAAQKWAQHQKRVADGLAHPANPMHDEEDWVDGPAGLPTNFNPHQNALDALREKIADQGEGPSRSRHQMAMAGSPDGVNPRLMGIMTGWSPERDEAVLRDLKAMRSQLDSRDLHYVMQACQRHCRTYKWTKKLLGSMGDF